jgi:hypothetical protein
MKEARLTGAMLAWSAGQKPILYKLYHYRSIMST